MREWRSLRVNTRLKRESAINTIISRLFYISCLAANIYVVLLILLLFAFLFVCRYNYVSVIMPSWCFTLLVSVFHIALTASVDHLIVPCVMSRAEHHLIILLPRMFPTNNTSLQRFLSKLKVSLLVLSFNLQHLRFAWSPALVFFSYYPLSPSPS